jgi:hypothetical protein
MKSGGVGGSGERHAFFDFCGIFCFSFVVRQL